MTFYAKPSLDLVFDLINKANPTLPTPLSDAVARLDLPKVIAGAGPADLNTNVKVSAKYGQGYVGTRVLNYRRINLGDFFKNTVAIVNKYKSNGQPVKFSDYLADFNIRYGFSLTADDFTDVNFPAATVDPVDNRRTASVVVIAKADSFGFTGSFTFRWKDAPQELKNLIVKPELPGRVYPPTNFVNMLTYGGDNTELVGSTFMYQNGVEYPMTEFFIAGVAVGGGAIRPDVLPAHREYIRRINVAYGTNFFIDSTKPLSDPGNLTGAIIDTSSAPFAAYPSANQQNFARVIVLKLLPAHTWGTGDLFLHHNYGV